MHKTRLPESTVGIYVFLMVPFLRDELKLWNECRMSDRCTGALKARTMIRLIRRNKGQSVDCQMSNPRHQDSPFSAQTDMSGSVKHLCPWAALVRNPLLDLTQGQQHRSCSRVLTLSDQAFVSIRGS